MAMHRLRLPGQARRRAVTQALDEIRVITGKHALSPRLRLKVRLHQAKGKAARKGAEKKQR